MLRYLKERQFLTVIVSDDAVLITTYKKLDLCKLMTVVEPISDTRSSISLHEDQVPRRELNVGQS